MVEALRTACMGRSVSSETPHSLASRRLASRTDRLGFSAAAVEAAPHPKASGSTSAASAPRRPWCPAPLAPTLVEVRWRAPALTQWQLEVDFPVRATQAQGDVREVLRLAFRAGALAQDAAGFLNGVAVRGGADPQTLLRGRIEVADGEGRHRVSVLQPAASAEGSDMLAAEARRGCAYPSSAAYGFLPFLTASLIGTPARSKLSRRAPTRKRR